MEIQLEIQLEIQFYDQLLAHLEIHNLAGKNQLANQYHLGIQIDFFQLGKY